MDKRPPNKEGEVKEDQAEEIDEVEKQEHVTKALQATVETHGMKHGIIRISPKGPKPQTKGNARVVVTPQRTPKKV